jgi:hypothetical protein
MRGEARWWTLPGSAGAVYIRRSPLFLLEKGFSLLVFSLPLVVVGGGGNYGLGSIDRLSPRGIRDRIPAARFSSCAPPRPRPCVRARAWSGPVGGRRRSHDRGDRIPYADTRPMIMEIAEIELTLFLVHTHHAPSRKNTCCQTCRNWT